MNDDAERPIRILLLEDNPGDARLVREALADAHGRYELTWADRLSVGLEKATAEEYDLLIVDLLMPPESRGIITFTRVHAQAPLVPKLVLTSWDDEELAVKAVQAGAQDYLIKSQIDGPGLLRAIRHALERYRLVTELRELSLRDELTGLHNRRGFFLLAEQQLKVAKRTRQNLLLFYVDLDGMKRVNDTYGHLEGDRALAEAAAVLRDTFRESDILARLGGDEFAVLSIAASDQSAAGIRARLDRAVRAHNRGRERPYKLSLSAGMARFDATADADAALEELMARADAELYERKRERQNGGDDAATAGCA